MGGNGGGVSSTVIGGIGLFADGTAAAPSISFLADPDTGFYRFGDNVLGVTLAGAARFLFAASGAATGRLYNSASNAYLELNSAGSLAMVAGGTNQNITLTPSGTGTTAHMGGGYFTGSGVMPNGSAGGVEITCDNTSGNVFAFRRGVGALPLILQGAGSNVLIGTSTNSGALLQIGTDTTTVAGGAVFGTDTFLRRSGAGNLVLQSTGSNPGFSLSENGTITGYYYTTSGNLTFGAVQAGKSTTLISAGTTALTLDSSQNATFAGGVTISTGNLNVPAAAILNWNARSQIVSPSDGVLTFRNAANTDFSRLQFGGTTNSFPSLKRSGANLIVRAADDSADVAILAFGHVSTGAAITAAAGAVCYGGTTATTVGAAGGASALPATPTGYIIVNVAGTQMKVPYYAN